MSIPLVSPDLVLRLETAEAAYNEAKLRALMADDGNSRRIEIARLGGTVLLSIQSRRQNPSFNRVMCFSRQDEEHLDCALEWMRDRDVRFWFDIAPALVDRSFLPRLARAGLAPVFFLNVVYTVPRCLDGKPPADTVIDRVDLQNPRRLRDFCQALSEGFGVPSEALGIIEEAAKVEYAGPEWRAYLASTDGEPAAMAAMHIADGAASVDAMATVPRHRNRGCQTALLERCIGDAARAGCDLLASQTGPGGTSERNMVRCGFRIAYTKALYSEVSPAPPPSP